MKRFKLLIFDWDGTLSDSESMIVGGMQAAISELGLPPRSNADIGQLIGLGLAEGMQKLYPEFDTDEVLRLLMSYRTHFVAKAPQDAPLFPNAERTLSALADAGYLLAVATGKSRQGLNRSFQTHPVMKALFIATRTADETANKPDPLMLSELLAETGVPAERALMIGDTDYDAAMARCLGMPMLGVTCGVHAGARILAAGAVALVESVADLPAWLDQGKT